jgi:hypothetical protein
MNDVAALGSWRDTAGLSKISVGVEVEGYADEVITFFQDAQHPTLKRPYVSCGCAPMIELLRYLEANGSGFGVEYRDGSIVYSSELDAFNEGPEKPLRIWARTGRRPAISDGDLEMLRFAGGGDKPALRLVVRHDDADREVAHTTGAEHVLDAGFTEISMRDDWETVFVP